MSSHFYIKHRLAGNTKHSLDSLNPRILKKGDVALTVSEGCVFFHEFATDCVLPHNPPNVIQPKYNNYKKRWLLNDVRYGNHKFAKNMFRGFSFFGEPPVPDYTLPFFYIWQSDGSEDTLGFDGDIFAKIRNTKGVLRQLKMAEFDELETISDIQLDFDVADATDRRKLHICDKGKIEGFDSSAITLAGVAQEDIEVGDLGIAFDGSSIAFYFASNGGYEENYPYVFYSYSKSIPLSYDDWSGPKCWVLSGIVGDLLFRDGGNFGLPLDSEPPNPPNNSYVMWVDDGVSRLGEIGDVHLKITDSEGVTKHKQIVDFSRISGYPILENLHITIKDSTGPISELFKRDKQFPIADQAAYSENIELHRYSKAVDSGSVSYNFSLEITKYALVKDKGNALTEIPPIEITKYVLIQDNYLAIVPPVDSVQATSYAEKKVSSTVVGNDKDYVYVYIKLEETSVADDQFALGAATKVLDRIFSRTLPVRMMLDFAYSTDIISNRTSEVITNAVGEETLQITSQLSVNDELIDVVEVAYHSKVDFTLQDTVQLTLSYNFSITQEAAPTVDKPDVSVDFSTGTTTPTIYGSNFNVSGGSTGYTHVASDWKILDPNGGLIFASFDDSSNLTSLQVSPHTLFENNRYVVYVRHEEQDLGKGSWEREWFEV